MIYLINAYFITGFLSRKPPCHEDDAVALWPRRDDLEHLGRKFLPAFPGVGVGFVCAYGETSVKPEDATLS